MLAPEDKVARLDHMEAVLLGQEAAGSPSATRLRASLAETGVTPVHSQELLIAFRQDATKRRYASWDELLEYCRYSAMPVGRHVLDLHGEDRGTWRAQRRALRRAAGAQPPAGLREGPADLDRSYLPQDMLEAAGAEVSDAVRDGGDAGIAARVQPAARPCATR